MCGTVRVPCRPWAPLLPLQAPARLTSRRATRVAPRCGVCWADCCSPHRPSSGPARRPSPSSSTPGKPPSLTCGECACGRAVAPSLRRPHSVAASRYYVDGMLLPARPSLHLGGSAPPRCVEPICLPYHTPPRVIRSYHKQPSFLLPVPPPLGAVHACHVSQAAMCHGGVPAAAGAPAGGLPARGALHHGGQAHQGSATAALRRGRTARTARGDLGADWHVQQLHHNLRGVPGSCCGDSVAGEAKGPKAGVGLSGELVCA